MICFLTFILTFFWHFRKSKRICREILGLIKKDSYDIADK
jgi:hypothetical protein